MSKPKPIKPFKTLEEEAAFWERHDLSPILKNSRIPLSALPTLETKKATSVTIRLQESIKKRITAIALKKGINSSTLSRMWLVEKVREYDVQSKFV